MGRNKNEKKDVKKIDLSKLSEKEINRLIYEAIDQDEYYQLPNTPEGEARRKELEKETHQWWSETVSKMACFSKPKKKAA